MKWLALAAALFVGVPLVARRMAGSLEARWIGVALLAFDLFNPAHINLVSDETYRGDSRGFEVTTVDLLAVALFVAGRMRRATAPPGPRFRVVRALYFLAVLASLSAAPDLLRSTFSVWKLMRMNFVFEVLTSAFAEIELVQGALTGLSVGVVSQGLMALQQKYQYHMVRVVGSQSHPNSLAMIVNLIAPMSFALILAGRAKRLAMAVFILAAMCDVFSLSRGGMMMFVLGAVIVVVGSMRREVTARKWKVVAGLVGGAVLVVAKSLDTIVKRFTEAPKESELARKLFNAAAKMMADGHTFGVGINMYSLSLDGGGYADRLGVDPGDRTGIAHHIYWLTAAETGYGGLVAYLLMLATIYVAAIRAARLPGVRGEIGLGIVAGLSVTYLQGTAEWIARQTTMSYCFWLLAAVVASFLAAARSGEVAATT